jgi:hypothetical protein
MGIFNSLKEYLKEYKEYKPPVRLDMGASIFLHEDACVSALLRSVKIEWYNTSIVIYNISSIKKRLIKVLKEIEVEVENVADSEESIECLSCIELSIKVDSSTEIKLVNWSKGNYCLELGGQLEVSIYGIDKIKTALIEALESIEE